MFNRFRKWYIGLPDKKRYFELLSAVLTIPVLITVILVNMNNLTGKKDTPSVTPTILVSPSSVIKNDDKTVSQPTSLLSPTQAVCTQKVGVVSIVSPLQDEVVQSNPVCIDIKQDDNYCPAVAAYRINGGSWSDYTNKTICLYNLSPGQKKLELKLKNTVSNDEVTLERNFTVPGESPTPSPMPPTATPQPTATITPTQVPAQ